jgi:hypothetical protein
MLSLVTAAGFVFLGAVSARAGSDSPTPYTVDTTGITLPDGRHFGAADVQDANVRLTDGTTVNIHYPGAVYPTDGATSLTWTGLGFGPGDCIEWVQLHSFDEHFGEAGQEPVCVGSDDPEPTPSPTTTAPVGYECENGAQYPDCGEIGTPSEVLPATGVEPFRLAWLGAGLVVIGVIATRVVREQAR